jgi:hypothetical protein
MDIVLEFDVNTRPLALESESCLLHLLYDFFLSMSTTPFAWYHMPSGAVGCHCFMGYLASGSISEGEAG